MNKGVSSTFDHIIKYTGLFGGVQGFSMLINVVRNMIAARLLGPSGMAIINLYNNALALIHRGTNLGLSQSSVKFIAEQSSDSIAQQQNIDMVRRLSLLTGLFGMCFCLVFSRLLSSWTFGDDEYTTSFIFLSPTIFCTALYTGELAIMRGLHRMRRLAWATSLTAILTLAICAHLYFLMRVEGIALSIMLVSIATVAVTLVISMRCAPWRRDVFDLRQLRTARPMIVLGLGFLVAGTLGQTSDYMVRTLLLHFGNLEVVGLVNAGTMLAINYASIIFVALENDFFPRLTSIKHDIHAANNAVNQQIEACILFISPLLIAMVTCMPIIVNIIFSADFAAAVPMAVVTTLCSFFRGISTPIGYLALAHGDGKTYVCTELFSTLVFCIAVPFGYVYFGIVGTGIGYALEGLLYMLLVWIVYRHKYSYRISASLLPIALISMLLLLAMIFIALTATATVRYAVGTIIFAASFAYSIYRLRSQSTVFTQLARKFQVKNRK